MTVRRMLKKVVATLALASCLMGTLAFADGPFEYSFHISDASIGYSTPAYAKLAGTARAYTQVDDITRDWPWYQRKSANFLIAETGTGAQVTDNVILSDGNIPGVPQAAEMNYIYNGIYYSWKPMEVCLRANSTYTDTGFSISGIWVPNRSNSYY